jgi:hypothetical protein
MKVSLSVSLDYEVVGRVKDEAASQGITSSQLIARKVTAGVDPLRALWTHGGDKGPGLEYDQLVTAARRHGASPEVWARDVLSRALAEDRQLAESEPDD